MIGAVGSKLQETGLQASAAVVASRQDATASADTTQKSGQSGAAGTYFSPAMRFDSDTHRIVIMIRNADTGKVEVQYPSERQLEAYKASEMRERSRKAAEQLNHTGGKPGGAQPGAASSAGGSGIPGAAKTGNGAGNGGAATANGSAGNGSAGNGSPGNGSAANGSATGGAGGGSPGLAAGPGDGSAGNYGFVASDGGQPSSSAISGSFTGQSRSSQTAAHLTSITA